MKHSVHFLPDDITINVTSGENLLSAAANAGIYIHAFCGGEGICGKCKVQLEQGDVKSDSVASLKSTEYKAGFRLACRSQVVSDITVRIPDMVKADGKSLKRKPITTRSISPRSLDEIVGKWNANPPVRKLFLKLTPPTLEDNVSDMQRLIRDISATMPDSPEPTYDHPELIQYLATDLREKNWEITVLLLHNQEDVEKNHIISVESGDTTDHLYGLAIDIGTTTLSGVLIDLNTGNIIAEASSYNSQIGQGEDVISRMIYAARPGGLRALQEKVISTINSIIEEVCKKVIISPSDICHIMAAGNTVMTHLLLGFNPKFIREAPYVPTVNQFPLTKASSIGILAHPCVRLFLYPCIASYVGGDIVSGVHACLMHKNEEITLFIDIGTNGEIVIGNKDWMICAACSAGPAFEGGGIRHGMRASSGAIENFHIHPETLDPMIVTIGHTKPKGICGSGLISIVSELLEASVIDQQGKFYRHLNHPRVRTGNDGWEYVLAWKNESAIGEDIVVNEVDLDNMIRAKGAMYAGYQTLLESVGMSFSDLDRIILAGNFGAYIDLERAISIGLLPDLERDRFFYLGNASMLGCRISLTDQQRFHERIQVRQLMTNLELSENPEFMNHYMAALFLPHTDMNLFPSVQLKKKS